MTSQALSVFGTTLGGGTAICAALDGENGTGSFSTPSAVKDFSTPSNVHSIATLPNPEDAAPEMTCACTNFADHEDGYESNVSGPESDGEGHKRQDSNTYGTWTIAAGAFALGGLAGSACGTLVSATKTIQLHNRVKKSSLRGKLRRIQAQKAKDEARSVSRQSAMSSIPATLSKPTIGE